MSALSLARQPILDHDQSAQGYELIYAHPDTSDTSLDGLLVNAQRAFDAICDVELRQLVGDRQAWINVTPELLELDLVDILPPERVVLELNTSAFADGTQLPRLVELREAGFSLALNQFRYRPQVTPLLEVVDTVKLDFRGLGSHELAHQQFLLTPYGHRIVAEGVATYDDFELATAADADLFQGYFFTRPRLLGGRVVAPSHLALMQLASALQDPGIELSELDRLISGDVSLSYRLLRHINSAYFNLRGQIGSIQHAIALLGVEPLRRWATMTLLAEFGDKPRELFVTALIRAHFCEQAGNADDGAPATLFTLGLFSVLDALNDTTMYTAIKDLPLTQELHDALVHRTGAGRLLDCITAIESGEFEEAEKIERDAFGAYIDSIAWSNATAKQLVG
jgi:EAL and modified HD-GYP domain-containing signal transduction protein